MNITCFDDLIKLGWRKELNQNNRVYYVRPDQRKVHQRRNLTNQEKDEIGGILFPGKKRPPTPAVSTPDPPPVLPDVPVPNPHSDSDTLTNSDTLTDSTPGTSSQVNMSSRVTIILCEATGF